MSFDFFTPDEIQRDLGERLQQHRLQQNLTQQALASRAGVALNTIKKLEAGDRMTLDTLIRAAQALGLVADLDPLFAPRVAVTIAELERQSITRQRARAAR